jgi:hypothetical protein
LCCWREAHWNTVSKHLFPGEGKILRIDINERRAELEARLDDLKKRFPPHSVPPRMWQELEELEDELRKLETDTKNGNNENPPSK